MFFQDKSPLSVGKKDKQVKIMGKFYFFIFLSNFHSFLYFMYYFFVTDNRYFCVIVENLLRFGE